VKLLVWTGSAVLAFVVAMMFSVAAIVGNVTPSSGAMVTDVAGIPPEYLQLYVAAGQEHKIDWAILAAIGKVETDHGRIQGGACATSSVGAQGPMQFMPGTWKSYGNGGDVCNPTDAIPAAARYLRASGAPKDYHAAIFAYNHAEWYVRKVLAQAEKYRRIALTGPVGDIGSATAQDVLSNPRIRLTPGQRADLRSGGIDPWLLATMTWIAERHTYLVTALRRDHKPGSNHEAGRAMDIGIVDEQICRGAAADPCADLARELAQVPGPLRSTELIYCFDPDDDPATDPGGSWTIWAQADHCDHLHVGKDGRDG
jgi:hypothetical protein